MSIYGIEISNDRDLEDEARVEKKFVVLPEDIGYATFFEEFLDFGGGALNLFSTEEIEFYSI